MGLFKRTLNRMLTAVCTKSPGRPGETLEHRAAQEALELSALLRVGGALESDEISLIQTRLRSVVEATEAAIAACDIQNDGRANVARLRY